MPTYSIEGPDGKTYSIDGPEGATREQVIAKIKERQASQPTEEPSIAADVGKSFASGVGKGAVAIPGAVGDIQAAASNYNPFDYLTRKYREAYPAQAAKNEALAEKVGRVSDIGAPKYPTSGQLQAQVEKVTGPFHEPQTEYGKAAQSVGEFVPSAFIGPGGPLTRAVTTVGGGLGAYGGEKVGEAVDHPEAGRFIGGLAGGIASGVGAAETQSRRLSGALEKQAGSAKLEKSAQGFYDLVEQERFVITNLGRVGDFVLDTRKSLDKDLILPSNAPSTYRALEHIEASHGDVGEMISMYETLGQTLPGEGKEYAGATRVRKAIGKFLESVPQSEVRSLNPQGSSDPQLLSTAWKEGRDAWRLKSKLEDVERAKEQAHLGAQSTGVGHNLQNKLRQELNRILKSDKRSRGYSEEMKNKIKDIVEGTWATNAARFMGKYAPGGPVSTWGTILAALQGGVEWGAIFGFGTTGLRHLGVYLTERQIRELEDFIKGESSIGRQAYRQMQQKQIPTRQVIPAAALRSELATGADSPLQ